jgi:hypothetical protein
MLINPNALVFRSAAIAIYLSGRAGSRRAAAISLSGCQWERFRNCLACQPKIFSFPPITSNLSTHTWSIKCR